MKCQGWELQALGESRAVSTSRVSSSRGTGLGAKARQLFRCRCNASKSIKSLLSDLCCCECGGKQAYAQDAGVFRKRLRLCAGRDYLTSGWNCLQVHFFHFRPLPQGQGSLRPILMTLRWGCFWTVPSLAPDSPVTLATRSRRTSWF